MKCSRCSRELSVDKVYAYQGKPYCDECLMEIGLHAGKCEPWASYLATRARSGLKGTEGLNETQKKIYEFIKDKGKATRDEVKRHFKLSESEMDAQLTPLMFSELVKEKGEKANLYLVAVK